MMNVMLLPTTQIIEINIVSMIYSRVMFQLCCWFCLIVMGILFKRG